MSAFQASAPGSMAGGAGGVEGWSAWRRVVEVATTLGGPLAALVALAVATLAGSLHLGRGRLEAGPDLVGPRYDGKADHFFNESGDMNDHHGHVVEGRDSTAEPTTYDYVRDADGNVYIDRRDEE